MEDVNIHTFRHTFASYLVMSGVDLVTVKELLGHTDRDDHAVCAPCSKPPDCGSEQDL